VLVTTLFSELDRYNVIWTEPGQTDRSSLPLGNGELGINVWVQAAGEIHFYLARTDARTELDRSVKLGKVRIKIAPLLPFDQDFRQSLILRDGRVEIQFGAQGRLQIFVDAEQPIVYVAGRFALPVIVQAHYDTWRTRPFLDRDSGVSETADVVQTLPDGVLFYHQNGATIIPFLAELQAVDSLIAGMPDLLSHRIFGGLMTLDGSTATEPGCLITRDPVEAFTLKVVTHSAQTPQFVEWLDAVHAVNRDAPASAHALERTANWWRAYWERSWLFVAGDQPIKAALDPVLDDVILEPAIGAQNASNVSPVTRAYVLTRWMFACMGRGHFPMLYSGGLFNLMPGRSEHLEIFTFGKTFTAQPDGEPTFEINPDERGWGHFYLWQNTRLPYHSMLERGEGASLPVLFNFYRRFWELDRGRAQLYYRAAGQHNTEIVHTFGLQPAWVYGLDRNDKPDGYAENRWGGAVDISPGLELLHLMLDYYAYTQDDSWLQNDVLPYAYDLLRFIATRFPERAAGKIVIRPIQSVETYWDTTNSLPVVAGLRAVVERMLALPASLVAEREFYLHIHQIMPELPREVVNGQSLFAPAETYEPVRKNSESPAFYAVFPFRLFGLDRPELALMRDTFRYASDLAGSYQPFVLGKTPEYPSYSGWQQHGMVAALLGLTEEARQVIENNCALTNPGCRFPAMWGPIYDAVPDIDHGANILTTLQLMAFQVDGDQIRLLPAWPAHWDVSFKLHAPHQTTVECVYRHGKIEQLIVEPAERRRDIICAVAVNDR
jgi:hypothetical protein